MTQFLSKLIQPLKNFYHLIFKREATLTQEAAIRTGIRIQNHEVAFSFSGRLTHCLVNALLLFCCVFATTVSFSTAFGIEYNEILLLVVFAVLSCIISCMNYTKLTQNLGYLTLFVLFCWFVISYRGYINSGFNAVLNDFYEYAAITLDMKAVKTFTEEYEDMRYITVTLFYLTVGFVAMLLLNFTFNNEQNPFTVFLILFPILQIGFYFGENPDPMPSVLLMLALICCLIFRFNRHFILTPAKKKSMRWHTKSTHSYMQYSSGKVMMQVTAVMMSFLIAFSCVVSAVIPSGSFHVNASMQSLKESTEPYVKQFLMYGLSSFFPNRNASGGIGYGQLGQAGSVVPDFQTDLTVTFTPYSYDTVYLKAFNGSSYFGNSWEVLAPYALLLTDSYGYEDFETIINMEAERLAKLHEQDDTILKGKMHVVSHDDLANDLFYPYYSLFDFSSDLYAYNDLVPARLPYLSSVIYARDYEYYVIQDVWNRVDTEQEITTPYDRYVHENYLSIWGTSNSESFVMTDNLYYSEYAAMNSDWRILYSEYDTHDVAGQLAALCKEQGFGGSTYEIVTQIQEFLAENYTYSLNPGKLPQNKDFVTYFLFENPYGYCSYFATAATLLFRTMGIPARYTEGYVVTMSDILDAEFLNEENYDDWMEGNASIGKTAVVQCELDDSHAHAWVEIYLNGLGWIPVEVTPASNTNDDDTNYLALWSQLGASGGDGQGNDALNAILGTNLSDIGAFIGKVLLVILIGFLLLFILYSSRRYYQSRLSRKSFYSGYSIPVLKRYQDLCRLLVLTGQSSTDNLPPSAAEKLLTVHTETEEDRKHISDFISLYRTAAYSGESISKEDYKAYCHDYKYITRKLQRNLSLYKRLKYRLF